MEGGNFDGQYFHLSVPANLTEALHLTGQYVCAWNPLHKGGVVDNHIRKDSIFFWLVKIETSYREILSMFNWVKNYETFLQICKDLDIEMKKLTNLQMTRSANSVRFVFINLHVDYSAVRLALVNPIASKKKCSAAKGRIKAGDAKCVIRKISSRVFV